MHVYAGTDPLTRRAIRFKSTVKTEQQAHIELGEYAAIAPRDIRTRQTNERFIRRTIKPTLGHLEVRKVRGPILDQLRLG